MTSPTDNQAILPGGGPFTLAGSTGTFAVTFLTAGQQTIVANDVVNNLTGASAVIAVTHLNTSHFRVVAPATSASGASGSVAITALDIFNNATGSDYTGSVLFSSTDGMHLYPAPSPSLTGPACLTSR